jgi:ABC-type multidrug transport system fused ATPase/permease subunit
MSYAWQAVLASYEFHSRLSKGILSAPMTFFDTTPIGRILNRFAKDMDAISKFNHLKFTVTFHMLTASASMPVQLVM